MLGSRLRALVTAARLEAAGVLSRPKEWVTTALLPLLWCLSLIPIFGSGLMTELPVGLVDLDRSAASREAAAAIEALPSVRFERFESPAEAERALASARTYATLTIPENWERENARGLGSALSLQFNKTYYAVGTVLEVDVKSALASIQAQSGAVRLSTAGGTFEENARHLRATFPDVYFAGNAAFNFSAYLLPTLFPGVLALAAALAFSSSLVREWRDGGIRTLLAATDGHASAALLGKLLPWFLLFGFAGLFWVAAFGGWMGWAPAGAVGLWVLGTLLLILSMAALATVLTALAPTWVIAVSAVVCLVAPTIPFTGFSYPLEAMDPTAAWFGSLLPLTHYLRLQSEVWVLGSPTDHVLGTLATLALFSLAGFAAGLPLLGAKLQRLAQTEALAERLEKARLEVEPQSVPHPPTGFWATALLTLKGAVLNRDTFAVFAGAVAFYLVFYGWPYGNQQIENVPVGVVDLDRSAASRRVVQALDGASSARVLFVEADEARALDALKRGRTDVLVTIPPEFEKRLARGENTTVHLYGNGGFPVKARALQAAIASIVSDPDAVWGEASVRTAGLPSSALAASGLRAPALLVDYRYNAISGYGNYTVPMVGPVIIQAVMLMGITMALGGWLAARRRPAFVEDALRIPKVGGLAVFAAFWALAYFWFLYTEGFAFWAGEYGAMANPVGTLLTGLFFTGAVTALALFVTCAVGTNAWTSPAVVIISAPVLFMTGGVWPTELMTNPIIAGFSQLLPTTPGVRAIAAAAQDGAATADVLPACLHLFGLTLLYLSAAYRQTLGLKRNPKTPSAGDL